MFGLKHLVVTGLFAAAGLGVGATNAKADSYGYTPGYAPAYTPAYAPAPTYVVRPPVYCPPAPVYYPAPVYSPPPVVYRPAPVVVYREPVRYPYYRDYDCRPRSNFSIGIRW